MFVKNGSEFYNKSMKSWLHDNGIDMYSINNKRKYVVAERYIKTLNKKIYEYKTSISKRCILIS